MQSNNYTIQSDSINFGGGNSSSGSYMTEDTLGEAATGYSASANYLLHAGDQQNHFGGFVSVSAASNVVLTPSIGGLSGGESNGSTTFTVIAQSATGYTATIAASTSPALQSQYGSFADDAPALRVSRLRFRLCSAK